MKLKILKFGGTWVLSILIILFIVSCGSSQTAADVENMQELKTLVENKQFEIQNEWAEPIGGTPINLMGNENYIRFEGDSLNIALPYYGTRHSGGGYGRGDAGIVYEGAPKQMDIAEEEGKMVISFEATEGNENLRFLITIYPNGRTLTSVNSSQRATISYRGQLMKSKNR